LRIGQRLIFQPDISQTAVSHFLKIRKSEGTIFQKHPPPPEG
jgi:hypothetical protein